MPRSDRKNGISIVLKSGMPIDIPMDMIERVSLPSIELQAGFTSLKFGSLDDLMRKTNDLMRKAGLG